jgi:hypothetical protein
MFANQNTRRPIARYREDNRESLVSLGVSELANVLAKFAQIVSAEWSAQDARRAEALAELEVNGRT